MDYYRLIQLNDDEQALLYQIYKHIPAELKRIIAEIINIAFIKDIKSAKKETNLNASQRIYLAIKSLVEEIFLFAGVYFFLLAKDESFITAMSGGLHSISFEVFSCENINTLLKGCAPWFNFVAVYQKACALILISLAIAGYLNSDNRCRNKYESDDNNDKKNDFTQT